MKKITLILLTLLPVALFAQLPAPKYAIGTMAPDFTLPDTAGKEISLSSFKGKYVLIDFWASWCKPCRMENPEVVKAYARYQQKGFEVLGVALEREGARGAWINAIKEDGLPWTQVTDFRYWKGDVVKLYSVQYVPQNYLLDPEGKVIATNLRGEDLQRKLAKVFKGK